LDQTNKWSFTVVGFNPKRFLVRVFPASKKFDSDLKLDAGCTHAHPCPPMNNIIAPMPTQNPWAWAWVWAPKFRALVPCTDSVDLSVDFTVLLQGMLK